MFEIIESILLSQFLMFMVLAALLVGVTVWAFRESEYAGYTLGWLMGILLIIIYQSLTRGETTGKEAEDAVENVDRTLTFLSVIFPSVMGIISGYGSLFFMYAFNRTQRRRSITIAIFTTLLVVGIYFVFGLSSYSSRVIGIFALAFAIGALFNSILNSTSVPTRYGSPRDPVQPQAMPGYPENAEPPNADLRSQQAKYDRLRRNIKRPK